MSDYDPSYVLKITEGETKIKEYLVSLRFLKFKDELDNWEVFNEDVWIIGPPKTGTNWLQEMIWMIVNDLDYEGAKLPLQERSPHWEHVALLDMETIAKEKNLEIPPYEKNSLQFIRDTKVLGKPMCIKTHVIFHLLPKEIKNGTKQPKIIFITRNPKDACVSFYYFVKNLTGHPYTMEQFAKKYAAEELPSGQIWDTTISYWKERHRPNLLFLTYEEMKKDLKAVINKTNTFLNKNYTTDEIEKLAEHLSFENMKNNPAVNHQNVFKRINKLRGIKSEETGAFIRSGKVGGYKEELSQEMIKEFDTITATKMKESGCELMRDWIK